MCSIIAWFARPVTEQDTKNSFQIEIVADKLKETDQAELNVVFVHTFMISSGIQIVLETQINHCRLCISQAAIKGKI